MKQFALFVSLIVLVLLFSSVPVFAQEGEPAALIIDKYDLLVLLVSGVFILNLVWAVVEAISKKQTPQQLDLSIAQRLQEEQKNREHIERLERMYQSNMTMMKPFMDAAALGLRFFAPLTPMKSDDAVAALLTDIQQPGNPPDSPVGEKRIVQESAGNPPTKIYGEPYPIIPR